MIASGDLGRITNVRAVFFNGYASEPNGALSWRFKKAPGGEQLNSSIDEALADAEVIAATAASAADGQWHQVPQIPGATFGHPRSLMPAHV
ncbi:MAG: hypothetical protein QOF53_2171 [Nocardioidaceae bacterium]|nr:hypothetical protein [Nocardioidaceae bacterium]